MIRSIRFHWISRLFKHSQRLPQGVNQLTGGIWAAPDMASANQLSSYPGALGQQCSSNYFNLHGAALNAERGRVIEVNEGRSGVVQNQYDGLSAGIIGHDGIPRYFRWDKAQGCMVPFEMSTPFLARLSRSFEAFLRSWRLG